MGRMNHRGPMALAVLLALFAASLASAQDPAPEAAAPSPEGGASLSERLAGGDASAAGPAAAELPPLVHVEREYARFGPQIHDGSSSIKLPALGANAEGVAFEIVDGSVKVRLDGRPMLPNDYAVAVLPNGQCLLRFLVGVNAGVAVEVTYSKVAGLNPSMGLAGGATVAGAALISGPGQALSLTDSSGEQKSLPVKMYYGREESNTTMMEAADQWEALQSIQNMSALGRQELGFSISNMTVGDMELTYGSVRVEDGEQDSSYRSDFVANNLLGSGLATSAREGDVASMDPEGDVQDVTWRSLRYGSQDTSKVWYVDSAISVDPNYSPVSASGASADISAFLQDTNKWGGRNLMSNYWAQGGSNTFGSNWKSLEGVNNKGRQNLTQFAGWELSHKGWGIRPVDYLSYSRSEFTQENIESRHSLTETNEDLQLSTPGGATQVRLTDTTLHEVQASTAPDTNATETTILSNSGTDLSTRIQTTSLAQRLSSGENPAMLRVNQSQWSQLNRLTGIEVPTQTTRTTRLENISVGDMSLTYANSRNEYEDTTVDPTESHQLSFSGLKLGGPVNLAGAMEMSGTDDLGMQSSRTYLQVPGFPIFSGFNLSNATYERVRESSGASGVHRSIGFNGNLMGGNWDATMHNYDLSSGFTNSNRRAGFFANPSDLGYSRQVINANYRRNLARYDHIIGDPPAEGEPAPVTDVMRYQADLIMGLSDIRQNGESRETVYKMGLSQVWVPGFVPGQFTAQGMQYRHVDQWGTLRPSYSWLMQYSIADQIDAGVRGFEHYGAGDELSFVSRTSWIRGHLGSATVEAKFSENPLLNETGKANVQPFLWLGRSKKYSVSMPVTSSLAFSAAISENAPPDSFYADASEFGSVAFYGSQSGSLRPTSWTWGTNWQSAYSMSYSFGDKGVLTLGRERTRFNSTAALMTQWAADLEYQIGAREHLALGYRNWGGQSAVYGETLGSSDVGGIALGEAYTLRYTRDWTNGSKLSLVVVEAGPLEDAWNSARGQWTSGQASWLGTDIPYTEGFPNTKVFVTYETPF